MTEPKRQKILYVITKDNWGKAVWDTLGFPIRLTAPSDTGNYRFPTPSQRSACRLKL